MKKALVVLLVLTCLGAAAFADVTPLKITGSLETGAAFVFPKDGTNVAKLYDNDSGNQSRFMLGIAFTAADGNWGLITRLNAEGLNASGAWDGGTSGTTVAGFDRAVLWAAPVPGMVTVKFGALDEETFATAWEGWGHWMDGALGAEVLATPISGLTIGYFLPIASTGTPALLAQASENWAGNGSLNDALAGSTIVFNYNMPSLMNVILGYRNATLLTGSTNLVGKTSYFWGGVDVNKAVPNLDIRFEFQAQNIGGLTDGTPTAAGGVQYSPFEEITYVMGAITLDLPMYQDISGASGSKVLYDFRPNVAYNMGPAIIGIGADFGTDNGYNWGVLALPSLSSFSSTATNFDIWPYVTIPFGANSITVALVYGQADTSDSSTTASGLFVNFRAFF
jgi:hypothetical protein